LLSTKFWADNILGIDHLKNLRKDVRRILKLILKNVVKECGLDLCGYCTHSNEYSDLIRH
jgi:hypothetical protein